MAGSSSTTRRPLTRLAFLLSVLAGVLAAPPASLADHHLVKRALQEARCIPASVREIEGSRRSVSYVVECRDASRRMLTLVCTSTQCFVDDHREHSADIEDGESP